MTFYQKYLSTQILKKVPTIEPIIVPKKVPTKGTIDPRAPPAIIQAVVIPKEEADFIPKAVSSCLSIAFNLSFSTVLIFFSFLVALKYLKRIYEASKAAIPPDTTKLIHPTPPKAKSVTLIERVVPTADNAIPFVLPTTATELVANYTPFCIIFPAPFAISPLIKYLYL